MSKFYSLLAVVALMLLASSAQASIVFDDFNVTAGTHFNNTANSSGTTNVLHTATGTASKREKVIRFGIVSSWPRTRTPGAVPCSVTRRLAHRWAVAGNGRTVRCGQAGHAAGHGQTSIRGAAVPLAKAMPAAAAGAPARRRGDA